MMKKNQINIRSCCICRTKKHKDEFIRLYKKENSLFFDENNTGLYHGYYLCYDLNHINKIINKKVKSLSQLVLDHSILCTLKDKYGKEK